jgi:hypothetical protein
MTAKNTDDTTVTLSLGELDALIAEKLASADKTYQDTLNALRAQVPSDTVPLHGGGPGLVRMPSWSLVEQELATKGEYPTEDAIK